MKNKWLGLLFALGCIVLLAALGTGLVGWGNVFIDSISIVIILLGVFTSIIGFLLAIAIMKKDKQKWIALAMIAVLLFGFSVLTIFTVGLVTAPLALVLLGIAVWKLLRRHNHKQYLKKPLNKSSN